MKKILPIVWNDIELSKYLSRKSIFNRFIDLSQLTESMINEPNHSNHNPVDYLITCLNKGMEKYYTKLIILSERIVESEPLMLRKLFARITHLNTSTSTHSSIYVCILDSSRCVLNNFIKGLESQLFIDKSKTLVSDIVRILDSSDQDTDSLKTMGSWSPALLNQCVKFLKSYETIDDMIVDTQIEGFSFHSNRDISRLKRVKYRVVNLCILINDVTQKSLVDGSLKNQILDINRQLNNVNPIKNDYLLGTVEFHILVSDLSSSSEVQQIVQYVDMLKHNRSVSDQLNDSTVLLYESKIQVHTLDQSDVSTIQGMMISLENKNSYNNKKIYRFIRSLYCLYKFQASYDVSRSLSEYMLIVNPDYTDHCSDSWIPCEIDRAIKCNKNQYISVHNSRFILGTKKIMGFFMLLFQYYGYYKPWLNIRRFQTNGIVSSSEYYKYDKSRYMDLIIQMMEHIMHFTDVMMTTIQKISIPEQQKPLIIFVGTQIPEILKNGCIYDDRYAFHIISTDFEQKSSDTLGVMMCDSQDSSQTNTQTDTQIDLLIESQEQEQEHDQVGDHKADRQNINDESNDQVLEIVRAYRQINRSTEGKLCSNEIAGIVFWHTAPILALMQNLNPLTKIFSVQDRKSLDLSTIESFVSAQQSISKNYQHIIEPSVLIIDDTRLPEVDRYRCPEYIENLTQRYEVVSYPLHHQYLDSSINTQYFISDDVVNDLTLFIPNNSDKQYKTNINMVIESDIPKNYVTNTITYDLDDVKNHMNQFLIDAVKSSRVVVTSDPRICLMGMCFRAVVIMYGNTIINPHIIPIKQQDKMLKQLKITLKQAKAKSLNIMLDDAQSASLGTTWRRFINTEIVEKICCDE